MKKIIVTSKNNFPIAVKKLTGRWAYISIECTDDLVESHIVDDNKHYLKSCPNVLNLEFDDVGEVKTWTLKGELKKAVPISDEQGRQIYEFAKTHQDFNILVHCTAGASRSQGVARALWDLFPETWQECEDNQKNPCLTPNIAVVAAIKRAYYEQIYKSDLWQ